MNRYLIAPWLCLGALALASYARAGSEPPTGMVTSPESTAATARAHYARGLALYEQREYSQALAEFTRAHALFPSPKLHFSIGQTQAGLRNYAAAFRELRAYVDAVGGSVPAGRRDQVERQLEALRAKLGRVEVTIDVADASIDVDGEIVGTSPLRGPLMLDAGSHRVGAARTGSSPVAARVRVLPGELTLVHFDLRSNVPAAASNVSTPLWIATGAFAAIALGTGLVALKRHRDYERSLSQDHQGDPEHVHGDLENQRSRVQRWLFATDVLAGVTALAAGTAIYFSASEGGGPDERPTTARSVGVLAGVRSRF